MWFVLVACPSCVTPRSLHGLVQAPAVELEVSTLTHAMRKRDAQFSHLPVRVQCVVCIRCVCVFVAVRVAVCVAVCGCVCACAVRRGCVRALP